MNIIKITAIINKVSPMKEEADPEVDEEEEDIEILINSNLKHFM